MTTPEAEKLKPGPKARGNAYKVTIYLDPEENEVLEDLRRRLKMTKAAVLRAGVKQMSGTWVPVEAKLPPSGEQRLVQRLSYGNRLRDIDTNRFLNGRNLWMSDNEYSRVTHWWDGELPKLPE